MPYAPGAAAKRTAQAPASAPQPGKTPERGRKPSFRFSAVRRKESRSWFAAAHPRADSLAALRQFSFCTWRTILLKPQVWTMAAIGGHGLCAVGLSVHLRRLALPVSARELSPEWFRHSGECSNHFPAAWVVEKYLDPAALGSVTREKRLPDGGALAGEAAPSLSF